MNLSYWEKTSWLSNIDFTVVGSGIVGLNCAIQLKKNAPKSKNFGFVICDNNKMYADIFISESKMNGAEHGDKVQAKLIDWPENSKNPFGKITTVLGKPGDHNTEMHSILLEYDLPYEFEPEVEKEAEELPIEITKEEIAKRRDMRGDLTFTIDPKDAKDFDDALSFTKLENGNLRILE